MIRIRLLGINCFILFLLLMTHSLFAQSGNFNLNSKSFNDERVVKYAMSPDFDSSKPYQLFMVLDESTLFDFSTSIINYIHQWKNLPQYIIIGVPNANRWSELQPASDTKIEEMPFYRFLHDEIGSLDYVKNAAFRTIIGHSLSARFGLQYFFRNTDQYAGIIAISPPLVPELKSEFLNYYRKKANDSFVYTCSSDNDLRFHKNYFLEFQKEVKRIKNDNVSLEFFKNQPNVTHTLMPIIGIQNGLLFVMDDFFHLPEKEISSISTKKQIPDSLFEQSYNHITDIYGISPEFRTADIQQYVEVYIGKLNFTEAHRLSDLFIELAKEREVYDLIDAYYLKGLIYEKQKKYALALEFYTKGFDIIPEEVVNKNDFEVDIVRVKKLIERSSKK